MKSIHMHKDRVTGLIAIFFAVIIFIMSFQLPETTVPDDIGPAVFPCIAAGIMLIAGIRLALFKKASDENDKPFMTREGWIRVFNLFGVMVVFAILLWAVGYIIATPIVVTAIVCMFSINKKIRFWKKLLYATVLTGVLYYLFYSTLGLLLPVGKFINILI